MTNVQVNVRFRPLRSEETQKRNSTLSRLDLSAIASSSDRSTETENIIEVDPETNTIILNNLNPFSYDKIYLEHATNEFIYQEIHANMLEQVWEGLNQSIVFFGRSCSGKSYTCFGDTSAPGLVLEFAKALFQLRHQGKAVEEVSISCSIYQIYQEQVTDLLHPINQSNDADEESDEEEVDDDVDLPESNQNDHFYHPLIGVFHPKVRRIEAFSFDQFQQLLQLSLVRQNLGNFQHFQHPIPSDVHLICRLYIDRRSLDTNELIAFSHMSFFDLAAISFTTTSVDYPHAFQLSHSMHIFKSCIQDIALDKPLGSRSYSLKDGQLTKALEEALTGNSVTHVFLTASRSSLYFDSLLEHLRLGKLLRTLETVPEKNHTRSPSELKHELQLLERARDDQVQLVTPVSPAKQRQLQFSKAEANQTHLEEQRQPLLAALAYLELLRKQRPVSEQMTTCLVTQWKQEKAIAGTSIVMTALSTSFPILVRVEPDDLLSRKLAYHVSHDQTNIGRVEKGESKDICLFGPGVLVNHCSLRYQHRADQLFILPEPGALCFVNDKHLTDCLPFELHHRDFLILGVQNVFQVLLEPLPKPSSKDKWNHACLRRFQASYDPMKLEELAIQNCLDSYNLFLEKVLSIRTLYQTIPSMLEEEATHDEDIDPTSSILSQDMKDPRMQAGLRLRKSSAYTTRQRRTTTKRFSMALKTQFTDLQNTIDEEEMVRMLSYVWEANCLSTELDKQKAFTLVPAIDHSILKSREENVEFDQFKVELWVKVDDQTPSTTIVSEMWSHKEFLARLCEMKSLYFTQPGHELSLDPFAIETKDVLIGRAVLFLGGLNYLLTLEEILPILNSKGEPVGELVVEAVLCIEKITTTKDHKRLSVFEPYRQQNIDAEEEQLQDYMDKNIQLRISIRGARGLPVDSCSNVFVQYLFYCDSETMRTERSPVKSNAPVFQETFNHNVSVHEEFIQYVVDENIEFEIYGNSRRQHAQQRKQELRSAMEELQWTKREKIEAQELVVNLRTELHNAKIKLKEYEQATHPTRVAPPKRHQPQVDNSSPKAPNPPEKHEKLEQFETKESTSKPVDTTPNPAPASSACILQ